MPTALAGVALVLLVLLGATGAVALRAGTWPAGSSAGDWDARVSQLRGWLPGIGRDRYVAADASPATGPATGSASEGAGTGPAAVAARPLLPPLEVARPVIPAMARVATSPLGQEAEAAYLAYLRVRGETLLSLDPGPLTAVMTGEALAAQTAELNARAAIDLPAQLVVRWPALAFFHAPDGSPTVVVRYVDGSVAVDRQTGRPLPAAETQPYVDETHTLHRQDGVWKVAATKRVVIGTSSPANPESSATLSTVEEAWEHALRVHDEAWLAMDSRLLVEVLDGEALTATTRALIARRIDGLAWQNASERLFFDVMHAADGKVRVEEFLVDASEWLDRYTRDPFPRVEPPTLLRGEYDLAQVDGTWKIIRLNFVTLGEVIR